MKKIIVQFQLCVNIIGLPIYLEIKRFDERIKGIQKSFDKTTVEQNFYLESKLIK